MTPCLQVKYYHPSSTLFCAFTIPPPVRVVGADASRTKLLGGKVCGGGWGKGKYRVSLDVLPLLVKRNTFQKWIWKKWDNKLEYKVLVIFEPVSKDITISLHAFDFNNNCWYNLQIFPTPIPTRTKVLHSTNNSCFRFDRTNSHKNFSFTYHYCFRLEHPVWYSPKTQSLTNPSLTLIPCLLYWPTYDP